MRRLVESEADNWQDVSEPFTFDTRRFGQNTPFESVLNGVTAQSLSCNETDVFSVFTPEAEYSLNGFALPLVPTDKHVPDSNLPSAREQFGGRLSKLSWSQGIFNSISLFHLCLLALLLHLLFLWMLQTLWGSESSRFALSLKEGNAGVMKARQAPSIKAYFVTAPLEANRRAADSDSQNQDKIPSQILVPAVVDKEQKNEANADIVRLDAQRSATPNYTPKDTSKLSNSPVISSQTPSQTPTETPLETRLSSAAPAKSQSMDAQFTFESTFANQASSDESASDHGFLDTGAGLFTQRYLQRQREQDLTSLIAKESARLEGQSLSVLTPDMEVLIVPNADEFSQPISLDLPLDPNRIVRQGGTCYRVVQLGTQINPYAENLGFPFNCSGQKINQAIDDAIQARLARMNKK